MDELLFLKVSRLRDTEASPFHTRVAEKVEGFNFPVLQQDIDAYIAEANRLRDDIRQPLADAITLLLRPLDRRRDRLVNLLMRANDFHISDTDDPTLEAAQRIQVKLNLYNATVRTGIDQQTAAVGKLLRDILAPANAADLAKLPLTQAVTLQLQDINGRIAALFDERLAAQDIRNLGLVRATRRRADQMFTRLIGDLNVLIRLTPGNEYADLIAQINTVIRAAEVTLATRSGVRARKLPPHDGQPVEPETPEEPHTPDGHQPPPEILPPILPPEGM